MRRMREHPNTFYLTGISSQTPTTYMQQFLAYDAHYFISQLQDINTNIYHFTWRHHCLSHFLLTWQLMPPNSHTLFSN